MTDFVDCCAGAASGKAAAEPAIILMNSRRLIAAPESPGASSYLLRSVNRKGLCLLSGHSRNALRDIERPPRGPSVRCEGGQWLIRFLSKIRLDASARTICRTRTNLFEYEQANCRGEIILLPCVVDLCDQL